MCIRSGSFAKLLRRPFHDFLHCALWGHSNYQIGPNRRYPVVPNWGHIVKYNAVDHHTHPLWTKVIGPHRTKSQTPITKSAPFFNLPV